MPQNIAQQISAAFVYKKAAQKLHLSHYFNNKNIEKLSRNKPV